MRSDGIKEDSESAVPDGRDPSRRKPPRTSDFALEPLLDTDEAAAVMKIHPKTLQKFARKGLVRGIHVGKLWRFRASEIEAWIDKQLAS
jgi:excisionase family DNA binding protein